MSILRTTLVRLLRQTPADSKTLAERAVLTHPYLDWTLALGVYVLCIIVFAVVSGLLFLQARSGGSNGEAAAAEGAAIDQVLLEKTLGSYEEKERRFQELKETKPLFTNPLR